MIVPTVAHLLADDAGAITQFQRQRNRFIQSIAQASLHDDPIDDGFDRVRLCFGQLGGLCNVQYFAVDPGAYETRLRDSLEDFRMGSFLGANDWCQEHDFSTGFECQNLVDN